jgi:hypothetical protein
MIDLLDPRPSVVQLEDIGNALASLARFTGHTRGRVSYTVAQHSVLVARALPRELQLIGLLHDAHEAYVGDATSPLKRAMRKINEGMSTAYDILEAGWQAAVFRRFELGITEVPPEVKRADLEALITEQRDLMGGGQSWIPGVEPWRNQIEPWTREVAAREFFTAFEAARRGQL